MNYHSQDTGVRVSAFNADGVVYRRTPHALTTIIGHPHTITHPTTQIIGHPEPLQIPVVQEIVSQQTLDEAEQRLNTVMKKLSQLDLTEIKEKIKIIANAIKERYEQDQN